MRTKRNQAYITVSLPAGIVVCTEDVQPSIFTCSTRVWLHGARMETSNLAEVVFQFLSIMVSILVLTTTQCHKP